MATAGRTVSRLNEIYSINCLVNAAMYLEANILEFYRQALDDEGHVMYADEPDSLFPQAFYTNRYADDADFSRVNIRGKYRRFLEYMEMEGFDEDAEPWESFDLLIDLRNYFVHFESEYHDASPYPDPTELTDRLAEKGVPSNPWLSTDRLVYPHRAFGPGLTSWAVHSAENLTDAFHSRVGADSRYENLRRWPSLK